MPADNRREFDHIGQFNSLINLLPLLDVEKSMDSMLLMQDLDNTEIKQIKEDAKDIRKQLK